MTTQEGIGERVTLERAQSALTGEIVVEDVCVNTTDGHSHTLRRMVFMACQNLVQSEAALYPGGQPKIPGPFRGLFAP